MGDYDPLKAWPDDPPVISLYRRVLRAAERGQGVLASAEEVRGMAADEGVVAAVVTHDELTSQNDDQTTM